MQTIVRNIGDFNDLHFEVDLTQYGKTGADVIEIVFNIKKDIDDTNLIFTKSLVATEITFNGTTKLDVFVQWPENEYTGFDRNINYVCGLYIQFTGDPSVDLHADQDFNLKFKKRVT